MPHVWLDGDVKSVKGKTGKDDLPNNYPLDILKVRYLLNAVPDEEGGANGSLDPDMPYYDDELEAAIRRFQKHQGWNPDGEINQTGQTWKRLNEKVGPANLDFSPDIDRPHKDAFPAPVFHQSDLPYRELLMPSSREKWPSLLPEAGAGGKATPKAWNNFRQNLTTVWGIGCAMTSTAMALGAKDIRIPRPAVVAMDADFMDTRQTARVPATPSSLHYWLMANGGYSGNDLCWGEVCKIDPVRIERFEKFQTRYALSAAQLRQLLDDGNIGVIAHVKNGGHWVLLTGHNGWETFDCNDPAPYFDSYDYDDMCGYAVYYFR